ncbi:MAG TPA: YidC/Oxa1 family membrane protein insertase [Symbiobacteriaceae bacterium]
MFAPEWLVTPMASLLGWFLSVSKDYGLAIILMTVAVRVAILPLTIYQTKSMKRMQEVQPRLKEVQTKYKDQPEILNQKMMELYKSEGVNPFSGCLPTLVQMPFLWAMFSVLKAFDPGAQYGFNFLSILKDLNAPHQIGLVALTVVSMVAQSYLSGAGTDPNQKMMMYMMPVMFGWLSWNMQGGVVLYWVVSTIFGLVQQAIYPGFPRLQPAGAGGPGPQGGAKAR